MNLIEQLTRLLFDPDERPGGGGLVADQAAHVAEQAGESAADAATAPDETQGQGAQGTDGSGDNDTLEVPFSLDQVAPEYREHVDRYVKQVQGAFTKKTQELGTRRQAIEAQATELADAKALYDRLESDDSRVPALREILERYGFELDLDDDDDAAAAAADAGAGAAAADPNAELQARIQKLETDQQEKAHGEYVSRVEDHVEDALDTYVTDVLKLKPEDGIPDHIRASVIAAARSLPPIKVGEENMPDMDKAIAQVEALRVAELKRYADSKRTPEVDASGSSGSPKVDTTNSKTRHERAMAIVGRHLGG